MANKPRANPQVGGRFAAACDSDSGGGFRGAESPRRGSYWVADTIGARVETLSTMSEVRPTGIMLWNGKDTEIRM